MGVGRLASLTLPLATIGLATGLLACAGAPSGSPSAGQPDDLAGLQQQVARQNVRISALETRVAGGSTAQAQPKPAAPTPTIVPAVSGLAMDGTTKGSPTAKVTVVEYLDYL